MLFFLVSTFLLLSSGNQSAKPHSFTLDFGYVNLESKRIHLYQTLSLSTVLSDFSTNLDITDACLKAFSYVRKSNLNHPHCFWYLHQLIDSKLKEENIAESYVLEIARSYVREKAISTLRLCLIGAFSKMDVDILTKTFQKVQMCLFRVDYHDSPIAVENDRVSNTANVICDHKMSSCDIFYIHKDSTTDAIQHIAQSALLIWSHKVPKEEPLPERELLPFSIAWTAVTPPFLEKNDTIQLWIGHNMNRLNIPTAIYRNSPLKISDSHLKIVATKSFSSIFQGFRGDAYLSTVPITRDPSSQPLLIVSFPYNGEPVALLHVEYLYEYVDLFVIIESKWTFSGLRKPFLYFHRNYRSFLPYTPKIQFLIIDSFPPMPSIYPYIQDFQYSTSVRPPLSESYVGRDNRSTYETWYREHYQRDITAEFLIDYYSDRNYIVVVVDADEIISRETAAQIRFDYAKIEPFNHLEMRMFYYNLNWMKSFQWNFPFVITDRFVNILRFSNAREVHVNAQMITAAGWHLSYFTTLPDIARKLVSFSHLEYSSEQFSNEENLINSIMMGRDLFSRGEKENLLPNDPKVLPPEFQDLHRFLEGTYSAERRYISGSVFLFITFANPDHLHIAYGLRDAIMKVGVEGIEISLGLELQQIDIVRRTLADRMRNDHERYAETSLQMVQIFITDRSLKMIPGMILLPAYIIYFIDPFPVRVQPSLSFLFSHAVAIWLQNSQQVDDVASNSNSNSFNRNNLEVLPLYSCSLYPNLAGDREREGDSNPENDIALYALKETKALVSKVQSLETQAREDLITVIASIGETSKLVHWNDSYIRDFLLSRSKVVIILTSAEEDEEDSQEDFSSLLAFRYLLSLGLCVMMQSRVAHETLFRTFWYDKAIEDMRTVSPSLSQLYLLAKKIVRDSSLRMQCERNARQVHNLVNQNVEKMMISLSAVLDSPKTFEFGAI